MSRAVVMTAGSLCGALVLFVGLPLAKSSPYPTPRDGGWAVASAVSYRLASVDTAPGPIDVATPTAMEAQAAIEWEALMAPMGLLEPPATVAAHVPEPITPAASSADAPTTADHADEPQQVASIAPDAPAAPAPKRTVGIMDEVDAYLWEVYQRTPVKRDSTGDFTWKDPAAAKRLGMTLQSYVIVGMDRDFREQIYHAGKAMDAAGIRWTMLSAFRDDYRQRLASGFKARPGNSLHGGSRATGGYGHGRAVDVVNADGDHSAVWRWVDRHGARYGLVRPMPGADPAHIQARGDWHTIAVALRDTRVKADEPVVAAKPAQKTKLAKAAR